MKSKRPVNLDIGTINLPLAALASITHRISGVVIFAGMAGLLYLFKLSLQDEDGFARVGVLLSSPLCKFVTWRILSALAYHMVAGCKHLLLDAGIGESKEAGPIGAKVVIAVSAVLIALLGAWLW